MTHPRFESEQQFSWVEKVPDSPEDYLKPNYYDDLLKEYTFSGRSDLELLDNYLETLPEGAAVLELGCGSGRATDRIFAHAESMKSLDLVDLSKDMVEHCATKYKDADLVKVHQSDSVDFLGTTLDTYSSVVSLWNLSHSIHQHMFRLGREAGAAHVEDALGRFLISHLEANGSMYLIHYDIQSPEQRLINPWRLSLWETADPNYDASGQSPSKELLDGLFNKLHGEGYVDVLSQHVIGDPIEYSNSEVALETFLNFHMEGHFNKLPEFPEVVNSLLDGFKPYTDSEGVVRIAPGAFIYRVIRTNKPAGE